MSSSEYKFVLYFLSEYIILGWLIWTPWWSWFWDTSVDASPYWAAVGAFLAAWDSPGGSTMMGGGCEEFGEGRGGGAEGAPLLCWRGIGIEMSNFI